MTNIPYTSFLLFWSGSTSSFFFLCTFSLPFAIAQDSQALVWDLNSLSPSPIPTPVVQSQSHPSEASNLSSKQSNHFPKYFTDPSLSYSFAQETRNESVEGRGNSSSNSGREDSGKGISSLDWCPWDNDMMVLGSGNQVEVVLLS